MSDSFGLGKKGEEITADFLKKHGFIIFKQNYHSRFGEIDIIAEKGDLLLFVEVKTRFADNMVSPADAVDFRKRQRMRLTAKTFLNKTFIDYKCRYDVSEVTVRIEDGEYKYSLNYIKNAFE
ncbi:MAG: YraN family protein [Acutalibacteraceae bacterium]|nr:YraN family protein [Acutalibacteraceae bacterium]